MTGSLSLTEILSLTDIEQIRQQLVILKEEETQVDIELDTIVKNKLAHVEQSLSSLEHLQPGLRGLATNTSGLMKIVEKTWKVAQGISDKVRSLDTEQSRVQNTLKLLDAIDELKAIAAALQEAVSESDLQRGCSQVKRFLEFHVDEIETIFQRTMVYESSDSKDVSLGLMGPSPVAAIKASQTVLSNMLADEFDTAVSKGSSDDIVKCFKLFPQLGQSDMGLDRFSAYVCGNISRICQDAMRDVLLQSNPSPSVHADLITNLFETVAKMIDSQTDLVQSVYGAGRMMAVMQRLQRETDIQASIIIDNFSEKNRLKRNLHDIKQYEDGMRQTRSTPTSAEPPAIEPPLDPRDLNVLLSQITNICQKANLFDRFLRIRAKDEAAKSNPSVDIEGLLKSSKLNEHVQTLISCYIVMEDYFIRRSIEKALKIDQIDSSGLTSSCVDDVFFILKTATQRAMTTCDADCLCALINSISRILELDFMQILQKKLSSSFLGGNSIESKETRAAFTTGLNNLQVSCEYTDKLAKDVEMDLGRSMPSVTEVSREKVKSCLSALTEHSAKFREILNTWVDNFFNQIVKQRLRPMMQGAYMDISYVLTEDEYAQHEATDVFLKRFTASFSKLVQPYQEKLTETNLNALLSLVLDFIAKDWERHLIANCRFNLRGSLRFDKDLFGMVSYLSDKTQWGVRDKTARLNQMATLLNIENVNEVYEYWGVKSGPIAWKFSANEVKKILSLRVDFNQEAIAKLKL